MSDEIENNQNLDDPIDGESEAEVEDEAYEEPADEQDYEAEEEYDPEEGDAEYDEGAGEEEYYDDYEEEPGEPAKMKREWMNSITTSKKVKREEMRRRLKRAMLFMLVFALVVTSVVYIMLLFIQENNVRITAKSTDSDRSISLSLDNNYWTPYLNAQGPSRMWNISYSPQYDTETMLTVDNVYDLLRANDVQIGMRNGENFICFVFMLRNNGSSDVSIDYEMTLENDKDSGLQNAIRVMWGQSFKNPDNVIIGDGEDEEVDYTHTEVTVYAALSDNPKLANTLANDGRSVDEGYIEYVSYPVGSDQLNYDWRDNFYDKLDDDGGMSYADATRNGYMVVTRPFENTEHVFERSATLTKGDIMYCYVCIWLEGSDFDCVDSALGGYVGLGINFLAY